MSLLAPDAKKPFQEADVEMSVTHKKEATLLMIDCKIVHCELV